MVSVNSATTKEHTCIYSFLDISQSLFIVIWSVTVSKAPVCVCTSLTDGSPVSTCNPEVFNFYTYLRTHPLLLRRHFASSDKAKVGLTAEGRRVDSISLEERRLFFTAAYAHLQAGCPMLALEVLSKMPKVCKHSILPSHKNAGISTNQQTSDSDWSHSALNGYESDSHSISNSRSDSVLSFDWSQPSLTLPDESLELKWDSDKDDDEEVDQQDEDESEKNQSRRNADSSQMFRETHDSMSTVVGLGDDGEDSDDFITPSNDILAAQLKFTACLKIMTNELRTLSTGYELEGGKLRYQLYQWLEREVITHKYMGPHLLKPCSKHHSILFGKGKDCRVLRGSATNLN